VTESSSGIGTIVEGALSARIETKGFVERRLRPDPEPREVKLPFVSVDDHLVEPPDLYKGRLAQAFADRAPRVVRGDDGNDHWEYDGQLIPFTGANAQRSWEVSDWTTGAVRMDQVRPGTWDAQMRVKDMDINGVVASLNFPSMIIGFAGQRFMKMGDADLGLATMRAYNDWIMDSWVAPFPDRFIPCQVTWLRDAELAASEIYANANRGFKAVAFSENPEKLGLPSLYSGYWDPFFRACEETQTVINLHIGSSSTTLVPSADSPEPVVSCLLPVNGMMATLDWLYAKIGIKFPALKVVISESGLGWIPMVHDRLSYEAEFFAEDGIGDAWGEKSITPMEALRRNFWFTTFYDPSAYRLLDQIGAENVMLEADYPHGDSTWPDSQEILSSQLEGTSEEVSRMLAWENARSLYRHEFDFAHVTRNMKLVRPLSSGWYQPTSGSSS
jgi:predicted TIM-barrel fold metal-dependent hydrolase